MLPFEIPTIWFMRRNSQKGIHLNIMMFHHTDGTLLHQHEGGVYGRYFHFHAGDSL